MTIIFWAIFVATTARLFSIILFCLLLFSGTAHSSTALTGKVINVADGDTITVLTVGNESIKVRLAGIDSPEGYNCKYCVVKFRSIEEAKRAGFRAHRECVGE